MTYILNTNLRDDKKLIEEILRIRGIKRFASHRILAKFGWNSKMKVKSLSSLQLSKLLNYLDTNYHMDLEYHRMIVKDIKNLVSIGCYRGIRHVRKLPVRGQRTHTNAKTVARVKKG